MHLRRLHQYLSKQTSIPIKKSNYDINKTRYNAELTYLDKKIEMQMDETGVIIFKTKISEEEINNPTFLQTAFSNLLKKILDKTMPVIKHQIDEGLMPLQEQTLIITNKKLEIKNFETFKTKNATLHTNREMNYSNKVLMFIETNKNIEEKFLSLYFFIKAYEHALLDLSEKMVELYSKTTEMNKKLEGEHMDVETLKEITRYLADKTKDVSLMTSRLNQMQLNYEHKKREWKRYKPGIFEKQIIQTLSVDERYKTVIDDFAYVQNLWNLLGEFMDRSLDVLDITTTRQESVESNKLQALVSVQTAQIIAASILSIVIAENIPVSAKLEGWVTIIIWLILFLIIMGSFKLFNRRKKTVKTLLQK